MVLKRDWSFKMPDCELKGLEWVPEENPSSAVVMLHGFSMNRLQFKRYGPLLAEHEHLAIAYDARGHGLTKAKVDVKKMVDDVGAVIESLSSAGISNIALIGQSLGGLVSMHVAARFPGLSGIVLLAAGIDVQEHMKDIKQTYGNWRNLEQAFLRQDRASHAVSGIPRLNYLQFPITYRAMLKAPTAWDAVSKVKLPVLWMHGRQDSFVSLEMAEKCFENIASKDKEFVILEDCDHDLEITKFDTVSQHVLRFLDSRMA